MEVLVGKVEARKKYCLVLAQVGPFQKKRQKRQTWSDIKVEAKGGEKGTQELNPLHERLASIIFYCLHGYGPILARLQLSIYFQNTYYLLLIAKWCVKR
jgi:hypothetical protein